MRKRVSGKIRGTVSAALRDKKHLERAKSILIVVLLISASALLVRSGMFGLKASGASPASAAAQNGSQQSTGQSQKVAVAGPYVIAVTDSAGSHCGLMYDGTELRQAYDRLSAYLGEALGSAGEPNAVSEKEWFAALKEQGVFFDFAYVQPLSLLASSLSNPMTSSASAHSAARFCIAVEADETALYYQRGADEKYYKCSTAISGAALASKLGDWPSNGASFHFENDYGSDLVDDCFLVIGGQAQMHSVSASNPVGTDYDPSGLAALFGLNSYMASRYTDADGTAVYVDGDSVLRVYSDGRVTFRNSSGSAAGGSADSLEKAVSAAAAAQAATVGSACGAASTGITYVSYDTDSGEYTVRYGYELGGCPVSCGPAGAARFTVKNGVIIAAELYFRDYSYSGEDESPLPAAQAMAIVQASGGGMPLLCYVDDGKTVAAGWIINN